MGDVLLTRRAWVHGAVVTVGAVSLVTACGPAASAPGTAGGAAGSTGATETIPAVFNFSTWGDYRFFQDGFQRMQKDYPKYAGVQWQNAQAKSSTDLMQRLLTDYTAKSWDTMPDVCEMPTSFIARLADANVLVDFTARLAPFVKDISPAVIQMLTRNGKQYAVPWRPNVAMVYYRKDVWDEAGIKEENVRTWEDYLAAGKVIAGFKFADGVKRSMLSVPAANMDTQGLEILMGQTGTGVFDPKTGEVTIDKDPNFRRAFQTWVRMVTDGIAARVDPYLPPWYGALGDGSVASQVSATWLDQMLEMNVPQASGKWRMMRLPAFEPGGARGAFQGGSANVVAINKPGLSLELVWAFMQHSFLNKEVTGDLTNTWKMVPAYLPAYDFPAYQLPVEYYGGQVVGRFNRDAQEGAKPLLYTVNHPEAMALIRDELERAWSGKAVDQAIADAAAAIRKNIGTST